MESGNDSTQNTIKFKDYLPLYGLPLLHKYGKPFYGFTFDEGKTFVDAEKYLEENPDLELNEYLIETLNFYDRMDFQEVLSYQENQDSAIEFVRGLFDNYKDNGGDPLLWIYETLHDLEINYSNYPALYIGSIQTNLLQWAEYYKKINFQRTTNTDTSEQSEKITMQEAALILVYRNRILKDPRTDPNKDADYEAECFGYNSTTSGKKLYREWKRLSAKNGITGFDETEKAKIKNMIRRIENILPFLKEQSQRAKAEADIKVLQMKIN